MSVGSVVDEIKKFNAATWLERPKDISSMLDRKGARGSNLTIEVYAVGDTNSGAYFLFMLYMMAAEKTGDLQTLKDLSKRFFAFQARRFKNYYFMEDSSALTAKMEEAASVASTSEELADLLGAAQRFFGQMAYWVDLAVPWSELSKEHSKLMTRGASE